MSKKFTYIEIAKKSKTSVGTVSRYFNNYNISDNAKNKIKRVLEEINYIPNFSASNLRRTVKEIKDIMIIVPYSINQSSYREIFIGANEACKNNGLNLFFYMSESDEDKYIQELEKITQRNPFGIILLLPAMFTTKMIRYISNIKTTNVVIYNNEIKNIHSNKIIPNVSVKDYDVMTSLIEKVMKNNNDNIAYIGIDEFDETTGKKRKKAFLDKTKNIKTKIITINNNDMQTIFEELSKNDLTKYKTIICGTHTIFKSLSLYLLSKGIRDQYKITDIGNKKNHSKISNNAEFYAFIDYFWVGFCLVFEIIGKSKQNKINNFKIL